MRSFDLESVELVRGCMYLFLALNLPFVYGLGLESDSKQNEVLFPGPVPT